MAVIARIFFLPFYSTQIIIFHINDQIIPKLTPAKGKKFKELIENYFLKNYFAFDAKYSHDFWNFYSDISQYGYFNTTTNSLEVLNRTLKVLCGNGQINFVRACHLLKQYKENYIVQKNWKVTHNHLNPKARKTIFRETQLLEIIQNFSYLSDNDKCDAKINIHFAMAFSDLKSYSDSSLMDYEDEGEI